jgi:two-component system probable response regulator PhcQ
MRQIMLVDDEPDVLYAIRKLIMTRLRGDAPRVEMHSQPQAALARASQRPFDLVIAAYRMPGMSGAEFLARTKLAQPDTVRVVMSASAEREALASAISAAEIFRCIEKPWDDDELVDTLLQALALHDRRIQDQCQADARQARIDMTLR